MTGPLPKREDIALLTAVIESDGDSSFLVTALEQFNIWKQQRPADPIPRLGMVIAALHSGDRDLAIGQADAIFHRRQGLPQAFQVNAALALAIFGRHEQAATILSECGEWTTADKLVGRVALSTAAVIGRHDILADLSRRWPDGDHFGVRALAVIEQSGLGPDFQKYQAIVAAEAAPLACYAHSILVDEDDEAPMLATEYWVPRGLAERRAMERRIRERLAAFVATQGLDPAKIGAKLHVIVAGMDRAADLAA